MYRTIILIVAIPLAISAPANARDDKCDFTALQKPVSVLSKPVSAIKGDSRVCNTVPPPRHSVWRGIQDPLDRSLGRIDDQQTFELSQIERSRDPARRHFELFWIERERQLRLDEQRLRLDQLDEKQRRIELDRREYYVTVNAGLTPLARQVEADRLALEKAKGDRDRALIDASNALDAALRRPGANRAELQKQYEQTRSQIRQQYEQERARILGD